MLGRATVRAARARALAAVAVVTSVEEWERLCERTLEVEGWGELLS